MKRLAEERYIYIHILCFSLLLERSERWCISEILRQQIPDSWCEETKRALTEGFQVTFRSTSFSFSQTRQRLLMSFSIMTFLHGMAVFLFSPGWRMDGVGGSSSVMKLRPRDVNVCTPTQTWNLHEITKIRKVSKRFQLTHFAAFATN